MTLNFTVGSSRPVMPALLALLAVLSFSGTAPLQEPSAAGLSGEFLVATSRIGDPRFQETVILMIDHDENGAMGLIVNRPSAAVGISELLVGMGRVAPEEDREVSIYYGGPVELNQLFVLHSTDVRLETSQAVIEGVALSRDPEMLELIAGRKGPRESLLAIGYAGWGPQQLEAELAAGSWLTVKAESTLVFAEDPAKTWQELIDKHVTRL